MTVDKIVNKFGKNCEKKVANYTVQRFINKPLLLDNRKFDVRAFMLVASTKPLIVYMFNETYFRATTKTYTDPSKTKNLARFVTNT